MEEIPSGSDLQQCRPLWRGVRGTSALALGVLTLLAGCAVGPDYRTPQVAVSQQWIEANHPTVKSAPADKVAWWTVFGDPVLERLIRTAYAQNLPLRIAGARVMEARAARGIAAGQFWPQLQQLQGAYSRVLTSRKYHQGAGDPPIGYGLERRFDDWSVGFDAAWEIDVWGKFRRNIEASDATLLASVDSYDDVLVTLVADVAASFVEVRTFEERVKLAKQNVELQKQTLETTGVRFKSGATTELDVQQAKANLTNTQALVPALEAGLRQSQNALCILLGQPPKDLLAELGGSGAIPTAPSEVIIGIPGELLRRRPDVRRAEREAAAQCARIGVAFADLLPQLSFGGSVGFQGNNVNDLFRDISAAGSFGPSFRWDIFNYGRLKGNVRVQDARFEQLLIAYEQAVLRAQQEVEDSLVAFLRSQERTRFLDDSVKATARSAELARIQYKGGSIDFIRLLNSEAFLVDQQDSWTVSRREVARNLIALNKALGGGWELRVGHEFVPPQTIERMKSRVHWGNIFSPKYYSKTDLLWARPLPKGEGPLLEPQPGAPAASEAPAAGGAQAAPAASARQPEAGAAPAKQAEVAPPAAPAPAGNAPAGK